MGSTLSSGWRQRRGGYNYFDLFFDNRGDLDLLLDLLGSPPQSHDLFSTICGVAHMLQRSIEATTSSPERGISLRSEHFPPSCM